MVDVDSNTPNLTRDRSPSLGGSIGPATKVEELRQMLLDTTNFILIKLGSLKREIQTITTGEQMLEKKLFCDALVEISKVFITQFTFFFPQCSIIY